MFEQDNIFTQGLVQIIRNLKHAGIEDITTEVVGLHNGNKHMKFRFYTSSQRQNGFEFFRKHIFSLFNFNN